MLYELGKTPLLPVKQEPFHRAEGKQYVGIFSMEDAKAMSERMGISPSLYERTVSNPAVRFESHNDMDIFCFPLDNGKVRKHHAAVLYLYLTKQTMMVCSQNLEKLEQWMERMRQTDAEMTFGRLLFSLFEQILNEDGAYLEQFEERVTELENQVIIDKQRKDYVNQIIGCRKQLVHLKRYFGQFADLFRYVMLNENHLLDKQDLKLLRITAARVDRLYGNVLTLIEYVVQIREAYQAEVDINLNTTMKIFTVVTSVFLPLTLIAGWYGMNFNMPEYHTTWGYPALIGISAVVVAAIIIYFKKKKWF